METNIKFNEEVLAQCNSNGFFYFCANVVSPPDDDPNFGLIKYWELLPFKTKEEAIDSYENFHQDEVKREFECHLLVDKDIIEEMAQGIPGLIVEIKSADGVLS